MANKIKIDQDQVNKQINRRGFIPPAPIEGSEKTDGKNKVLSLPTNRHDNIISLKELEEETKDLISTIEVHNENLNKIRTKVVRNIAQIWEFFRADMEPIFQKSLPQYISEKLGYKDMKTARDYANIVICLVYHKRLDLLDSEVPWYKLRRIAYIPGKVKYSPEALEYQKQMLEEIHEYSREELEQAIRDFKREERQNRFFPINPNQKVIPWSCRVNEKNGNIYLSKFHSEDYQQKLLKLINGLTPEKLDQLINE